MVNYLASKKYVKDYRLEDRVNSKGKVRREAHYCGAYFTYQNPEAAARLARRLPIPVIGATACTVGTLLPACGYMRAWYTTIPMVVLLPSLYMLWAGLCRMRAAEPPFTRERRDRIADRIAGGGAMLLILSIIAALCGGAYLIFGGPQDWDYGCFAMDLFRVLFAALIFPMRKDAAMVELTREEPREEAT